MFSDAVLDHFRNPRNAGELPGATATVEVSNPVCGDILKLSARIVDRHIAEARFLCRGCTTSIACASLLTVQICGRSVAQARTLTPESLSISLGGLPPVTACNTPARKLRAPEPETKRPGSSRDHVGSRGKTELGGPP